MISINPEGYYALTSSSDNFTITPELLVNFPQGLAALEGNDSVIGSTLADFISGNQGDDSLFGNDGSDLILGNENNDYLDGGAGDDSLAGEAGQDIIWGNLGEDLLNGGEGADVFVIQLHIPNRNSNFGDQILDFNPQEDVIGLKGGFTEESIQLLPFEWGTVIQDPLTKIILATVYAVSPEQLKGRFINADTNNLDITNNLPNGATDLGLLINPISTNNFVGNSDVYDFYRFSVDTVSEVKVDLTGLSADADLFLISDINSNGLIDDLEVLNRSQDSDLNSESIIHPLLLGSYIIAVRQYQGDTNYNLTLSTTPLPPLQPDNAGQTLTTAASLGTINGTLTRSDFIDPVDDSDIYKIQLETPSDVIINLNFFNGSTNADGDLLLMQDSNGNGLIDNQSEVIVYSLQQGTTPETITLNQVNPGEYFVVVEQAEGHTAYTLDVSATPQFTSPQRLPASEVPNYNSYYGWGIVDAAKAVAAVTGQTTPYSEINYPSAEPFIDFPTYDNIADLNAMNVPEVWNQGYTGKGVIVAVLDSGVDLKHFDLANNIWVNPEEANGQFGVDDDNNGYVDDVNGYDFVGQDANPNPSILDSGYYHGTHVAGIIAAVANGETLYPGGLVNVNGVAFNAQIMPVRAISTKAFDKTLAEGILYATNNGAKVINISAGELSADSQQQIVSEPQIQQALEYAKQKGVTVVISAGNERNNFAEGLVTFPTYPSRFSENNLAISVGAVDVASSNQLSFAGFSNPAGVKLSPFVVAPGVDVLSTFPENTYEFLQGTSMAAPYVSGVVALMLEANPNLTVEQIQEIIAKTANPQAITGIEVATGILPNPAIAA